MHGFITRTFANLTFALNMAHTKRRTMKGWTGPTWADRTDRFQRIPATSAPYLHNNNNNNNFV